jgi:phage-related protein
MAVPRNKPIDGIGSSFVSGHRSKTCALTEFFPKMRGGPLDINFAKCSAVTTQMTGKPFDDVGAGTKEIRIKQTDGAFRVM